MKNPPNTYQKLMERTQKQIQLDDEIQALQEDKKANQLKMVRMDRRDQSDIHVDIEDDTGRVSTTIILHWMNEGLEC